MTRRSFLKTLGITTGVVAVGTTGGFFALDHHFTTPNPTLQKLSFSSLKEAQLELDVLEKVVSLNLEKIELLGEWSLHQNLVHCAQSIEYSLTGYPTHKPELIKKTIGKWAFEKFDTQNYMKHDRNDPIPDAEPILKEGDLSLAFQRLRKSISDFESHQGSYQPHFVYGSLSKSQYEKAHYLHLADHLSGMKYS